MAEKADGSPFYVAFMHFEASLLYKGLYNTLVMAVFKPNKNISGRKRVLQMSKLIAFVAANAVIIVSVISLISNLLSKDPVNTQSSYQRPHPVVNVISIALAIAVIVACYIDFEPDPDKPGGVKSMNPTGVTEKSKEIETVPKVIKALSEDDYSIVEASSTYNGDRATHIAYNLLDGNPKTNWTEGVPGYGEGEWIDFHFRDKQSVVGFTIWAGNHYDDSYYVKNARPKTITLTFADGSTKEYALGDKRKEQTFYFDQAVETESVRLTITSVYTDGSVYEDTVISEITFLVEES